MTPGKLLSWYILDVGLEHEFALLKKANSQFVDREPLTMTQQLKGKVSMPDGVLIRELDGEAVLLNLNSESYFGLDAVGTRMWAVLMESPSIQAAYEILLGEYEVEPESLRKDLSDFVEKLATAGLIDVSVI
jgi:hypothetical protein